MKTILTIAGSDSGGGAGIQADLKTATVLGAHSCSVITALTAQNTQKVEAVYPIPESFVQEQLAAVYNDFQIDAVKIGMLAKSDIIESVAHYLGQHNTAPLVLDPVMVAQSGDYLLPPSAITALSERLFPLATVLTPNIPETQALCGLQISSLADMKKAAAQLERRGCRYILIKGGHLDGAKTDLLFNGRDYREYSGPTINSQNTHGTGCTLSTAIAVFLAQGHAIEQAVGLAKDYVTLGLQTATNLKLGQGAGPLNHLAAAQALKPRPNQ